MKCSRKKEFPCGSLVLLAPPDAFVPRRFENVRCDASRREFLLAGLQRLRGKLYLEDGAIGAEQLCSDGRHRMSGDEHAWHVLSLDRHGHVAGCARYLAHPNTIAFHRLAVRHAALAESRQWGGLFRDAVAKDVDLARRRGVAFVEVGGWALAPHLRRSREGLRIALATYGLARALGGCIGITNATRRHCSSEILRRIGGEALRANQVELPAYHDPQYGCEMELLRFDSLHPNPQFEPWVNSMCAQWLSAPVLREEAAQRTFSRQLHNLAEAVQPTWAFEENLTLAVQ